MILLELVKKFVLKLKKRELNLYLTKIFAIHLRGTFSNFINNSVYSGLIIISYFPRTWFVILVRLIRDLKFYFLICLCRLIPRVIVILVDDQLHHFS